MSPCGAADPLPSRRQQNLAAERAGGILDDAAARGARAIVEDRARSHGMPIWCTHRIALRARRDGAPRQRPDRCCSVVGLDVDEDRHGAAIADRVGRRDEGMADGDDLVAGADAEPRAAPGGAPSCSSRPRRRAARRRRRRTRCSNAATSGPCVTQPERIDAARRLGLRLAEDGLGDRDHSAIGVAHATPRFPRLGAPPGDEVGADPPRAPTSRLETESCSRACDVGQAAGHGVDLARRAVLGARSRAHHAQQQLGEVEQAGLGAAGDVEDVVGPADCAARMLARAMSST